MGRKRVYRNQQELAERNRRHRMASYWRHAEQERKSSLERYYNRKHKNEEKNNK